MLVLTKDWCLSSYVLHIKMLGVKFDSVSYCNPSHSNSTSVKLLGGKGVEREYFRGQKKSENMRAKHTKEAIFAIFYAKIIKFGLILTHLSWSLFWGGGANWRARKYFGGQIPPLIPLCGAATAVAMDCGTTSVSPLVITHDECYTRLGKNFFHSPHWHRKDDK